MEAVLESAIDFRIQRKSLMCRDLVPVWKGRCSQPLLIAAEGTSKAKAHRALGINQTARHFEHRSGQSSGFGDIAN